MYLLAGNGGAADWWDDALPHFQCYQVVTLELPGFGDNRLAPCEDLAAYGQALLSASVKGSAMMAVGVNALLTTRQPLYEGPPAWPPELKGAAPAAARCRAR